MSDKINSPVILKYKEEIDKMHEWTTVERPGYLGKHRDEKIKEWNEKYGADNWRLAWKIGKVFVDQFGAYALYEDAYFEFLKNHPIILHELVCGASNVYDDKPSNVNSGFDYNRQETSRTHLQDIAIRRSLVRLRRWFKGNQLIQIRQDKGMHPLSIILSPGKVPFHKPELIEKPELEGWWNLETIESFYQSNKFLQVKKL